MLDEIDSVPYRDFLGILSREEVKREKKRENVEREDKRKAPR